MLTHTHNKLSKAFDEAPVWGAVIFGSTVSNDADKISDVDIMVFSEEPLGYSEYMDLYLTINSIIDKDVDLVDFTTAKDALLKSVKENHKVIYGNEKRVRDKLDESITDEPLYIKDKNEIIDSKL